MPGRLLVVSNTPFLPATEGNRERIRQMLGWLTGRGWAVSVLLLPDADVATWDVVGMAAVVARVEVAEPPSPGVLARAASRFRRRRALRTPAVPLDVDAWCPPWFRERVRRAARAARYDAVLVEYVFLSACLDGLDAPRPLTVVDTHDLMHRRPATYAAAGVPLQWFHTTRAEEARGLARADVVLAIDEGEARVLREMVPGTTVLTVPHGRVVAPAPPAAAVAGRVLYVGSRNDLNVAGLRWFFAEVWPAVRRAVPAAELLVYGTVAEKLGPPPPGVVVRGAVAALEEAHAEARVVVNPAAAGTGLPVKTVDALCHGRPVVATPTGAAGIPSVVVAHDADAFARAVARLLLDDVEWARCVAAAVRDAAARFSADAAFASLDARLTAGVR